MSKRRIVSAGTVCVLAGASVVVVAGAVGAGLVPSPPRPDLRMPQVTDGIPALPPLPSASVAPGADLPPLPGVAYAPAVGSDGESLVGPDGRDRCVVIAPPPAAFALAPDPGAGDPALYDTVQAGVVEPQGETLAVRDRPITLAETVPCP